ncbi:MAG: sulfotransferase [Desulfobulbaceae bacterium]|nr:sulfotransferase [Desulfobulbaceae bacterium]
MQPPILITGCARSGTSLTAGIIQLCGAFGGDTAGPNQFNKKGMFENLEIRDKLCKPHLKSIGCDPLGQKPLPSSHQNFNITRNQAEEWKDKIEAIFKKQGYKTGPWFYKGAKACLFWYLWHLAFPTAKWIIVRRDADDIARSCMQTRFMRAYHDVLGWLRWIEHHERCFRQMTTAGISLIEVWPKKMIEGDFSEIKEVIGWLDLEYKEDLITAFVDPALYGRKS